VPIGQHNWFINYRQDWLKEEGLDTFPDTWDEALIVGKKLKAKGRPFGLTLSDQAGGDGNAVPRLMLWAFGGKEFNPDGSLALDSKETLAALEFCIQLHKDAGDPGEGEFFADRLPHQEGCRDDQAGDDGHGIQQNGDGDGDGAGNFVFAEDEDDAGDRGDAAGEVFAELRDPACGELDAPADALVVGTEEGPARGDLAGADAEQGDDREQRRDGGEADVLPVHELELFEQRECDGDDDGAAEKYADGAEPGGFSLRIGLHVGGGHAAVSAAGVGGAVEDPRWARRAASMTASTEIARMQKGSRQHILGYGDW
jgi:hypothetical protein